MIYTDRCVFDYGAGICEALNVKYCEGCKFRKTAVEFVDAQKKVDKILNAKGLNRVQKNIGKNTIMSTEKRGGK